MIARLLTLVSALLLAQALQGNPPEPAPSPRPLDLHQDPMPAGTLARMGSIRWQLGTQSFGSVVFSADGQRLMAAGGTGLAQVWDAATGKEICRLGSVQRQGPAFVSSPSLFSLDGRLLAAYAGIEKVFRVYETSTGKELWKVDAGKTPGVMRPMAFAPKGQRLILDVSNSIWSVRNAETGEEFCQLPQSLKDRGFNPVFAPDGQTFATTNQDGVLRVWDAQSGKKLHEFGKPIDNKTSFVSAQNLSYSADGQRLAHVSTTFQRADAQKRFRNVMVWEADSGKELQQIKLPDNPNQNISAFTSDLRHLAYIADDLSLRLYDLEANKELHRLGDPQPNVFGRRPLFAPDGKTLVVTGNRNDRGGLEVQAWDVVSGKELWHREVNSILLAFSPDSARVATAAPIGGSYLVQLWDARTGKDLNSTHGHRGPLQAMALSRDHKTLTTQAFDGVRQWDLATGRELRYLESPEASRRYLRTISADGQVAAYMTEANGMPALELWDVPGNRSIRQVPLQQPGTLGLNFSPDGQILALRGADRLARLVDVATGKERVFAEHLVLPPGTIDGNVFPKAGFVFSPDGAAVATTWNLFLQPTPNTAERRDMIFLARTSNGRPLGRIDPGRSAVIQTHAFSPDGRNLVGIVSQPSPAGNQQTTSVVLWEAVTGKERHRFTIEPANMVAVSPDSRMLAVGRFDGAIHLHEMGTGRELAKLTGHLSGVSSLLFSPDGKQLISGSSDTTALVWDLSSIRIPDAPPATNLTAQQLEAAWNELAGDDAGKAYQAIQRLGAAPQTLPWLQVLLKPVANVDRQRLEKLVADLENNDFQVREQAVEELEKVGELALPVLEAALAAEPTLEARKRLEQIRDRATGIILTGNDVRILRALETLQRIGNPDAKGLLEKLAQGAGGARQTREAQAALNWLSRRDLAK